MLSKIVSVGDRVDLVIIRKGESSAEDIRISYPSKVCDITGDDKLVTTMPVHNNKLVLLAVGQRFDIYFYSRSGMYRCKAVILDRYKENSLYLLEMEVLTDPEKYQRRQYYRLETMLNVKYKVFSEEEYNLFSKTGVVPDTLEKRNYVEGTTVDISGGGIKFVSKEQLEKKNILLFVVTFEYAGVEYKVMIIGNVLTSTSVVNRSALFEHRMEYMMVKKEERELIIKYIFEEERRKRKNRKA